MKPKEIKPPVSLGAERQVLGGLIISSNAWEQIADKITALDFYSLKHQLIFDAISNLYEISNQCDLVTLQDYLVTSNQLEECGGGGYLKEIVTQTPGASNIIVYADVVKEKSILRSLIDLSTDIINKAELPDGLSSDDVLEHAERVIFKLAENKAKAQSSLQPIKNVLGEAIDTLEKLTLSKGEISGLPYGWGDLDKLTSGMQPSDLIIIAGRPAMGKTSFAMNIVEKLAITGRSVAMFSMEMSCVQIVMRMFSSLARINQGDLRKGEIKEEEWPRLGQQQALLAQSKLFIDDSPALTPAELRARVRRLKRQHGLDLVVVDYLQLMHVGSKSETRATEIGEISRSLKAIAKELDIPVIALSQLNRSLEQRQNKRPIMSDLRESGSIEQDADLILFIYRDEVYNKDTPHKGKAEIIVGKHRHGSTGVIPLTFLGQYTRFENFINEKV